MKNYEYQVIDSTWKGNNRVEIDLGFPWETEKNATKRLSEIKKKTSSSGYGIRKRLQLK